MGKTAIALNIALSVAKTSGKAVAVFSLEMSREQLVARLLSGEGPVDSQKLLTGDLSMVTVPDERLDFLAALYNPKKKTPAVIEFVDIAGLVKGASRGEGLGNKFLDNIRATDAIVHDYFQRHRLLVHLGRPGGHQPLHRQQRGQGPRVGKLPV